jgi:thiamine-phosphate pyrophosphorylase
MTNAGGPGGARARTGRPFPRLIAITDLSRVGPTETLVRLERLAAAASPGTVMLQLRDRERSSRERLAFGRELSALCRRTGQFLQVNDRLDLAMLLEADAVHLGEASVATADARRLIGSDRWITQACHDVTRVAETDADGVVLSPILAARKGRAALGVEALQEARRRLDGRGGGRGRLIALGGVDAAGARDCFGNGADAVAVVGAGLAEGGAVELLESVGIRRGIAPKISG